MRTDKGLLVKKFSNDTNDCSVGSNKFFGKQAFPRQVCFSFDCGRGWRTRAQTYTRLIQSLLGGLKGLNRLSSQLLLLAQTSADEPQRTFSPIRIVDVLWSMKEELLKISPHCEVGIVLGIALNHESLQVEGDEQLMKVAIMNLLDNGCNTQTIAT